MNVPRPRTVLAIARRDLEQELTGRRGILFTAVTAILLLPLATIQVNIPPPEQRPPRHYYVNGVVPAAVVDLPNIHTTTGPANLSFRRDAEGVVVVKTNAMPKEVRAALDGDAPEVAVSMEQREVPLPGRTVFFALISASVLTGAVSESIGGERSRRILGALLSAAVTRGEVVLGKWLAWAGYGGGAGLLAALLGVVLGTVEAGWWLLPLPTVAASAVALAMYLSRHARDVVGGATVSLRYLPAVVAGTGVISWYVGDIDALVGAALPIGGALLASGDTWPGLAPALVGTASALGLSAVCLALTARDLEQPPEPPATLLRHARDAAVVAAVAGLSWWAPLTAPMLWAAAGNPVITEALPRAPGVWAGGLALLLMTMVRGGQSDQPRAELGLSWPPSGTWVVAMATGVALAVLTSLSGLVPLPEAPLLAGARIRLAAGLQPVWVGIPGFVLAVVAQELLYRGWLQKMVGPVFATAVFVLVHGPLDPVRALVVGASLAAITVAARGSVFPAILARLVWGAAALVAPAMAPVPALAIATALVAGLVVYARMAAPAEGNPPGPVRVQTAGGDG